jgi:hypothetical protein
MKKLSMINEHLWSGIIKRSETGEMRKENSYMSEIVDYLNKHYEYYPYNRGDDKKKIIEEPVGYDYILTQIYLILYESSVSSVRIYYTDKNNGKYQMGFSATYQFDDVYINKLKKLANDFNGDVDTKWGNAYFFHINDVETIYNILDEFVELFSIKKSLIKIES